jgi:membrane protein required for colicin V production
MGQDIFDLLVVLVLVFFAGRGFFHGFVEEAAGLLSLLGGFWAARTWHSWLAGHLAFINEPLWRSMAAYALIFFAVIVFVGLLARLLQKILVFSFVAWADKAAGAFVGLAKGLILCALFLLVLQKFFYNEPFIKNSRTIPYLSALTEQAQNWLPQELRARVGL